MRLLLLSILSCLSITTFSQTGRAVYFELGGPGVASFNFDTRFGPRNDGIGGRIGIGGFSIDDESVLFIPVQVNYLLGNDDRHYFEFGAGATLISTNTEGEDDGLFQNTFGHLHFGYRLQPSKGGFMFRAAIIPIFGQGDFIPYYAGVSFGYRFANKKP